VQCGNDQRSEPLACVIERSIRNVVWRTKTALAMVFKFVEVLQKGIIRLTPATLSGCGAGLSSLVTFTYR
jgi:hypothetical protein